jgi:hypothetical protein
MQMRKQEATSCNVDGCACYLFGLLFDSEDGGINYLRNVSDLLPSTWPRVSEISGLHTKIPLLSLLRQQCLMNVMRKRRLLYCDSNAPYSECYSDTEIQMLE